MVRSPEWTLSGVETIDREMGARRRVAQDRNLRKDALWF